MIVLRKQSNYSFSFHYFLSFVFYFFCFFLFLFSSRFCSFLPLELKFIIYWRKWEEIEFKYYHSISVQLTLIHSNCLLKTFIYAYELSCFYFLLIFFIRFSLFSYIFLIFLFFFLITNILPVHYSSSWILWAYSFYLLIIRHSVDFFFFDLNLAANSNKEQSEEEQYEIKSNWWESWRNEQHKEPTEQLNENHFIFSYLFRDFSTIFLFFFFFLLFSFFCFPE